MTRGGRKNETGKHKAAAHRNYVELSLISALARVSSEPAVGVMAAFAINANISENTNPFFTQR